MTDREVMQQALEALEGFVYHGRSEVWTQAIRALHARLTEPLANPAPGYCKQCKQYTIEEPLPAEPEPEPVAWRYKLPSGKLWHFTPHGPHEFSKRGLGMQPLYTAPPTRSPLTDDEISAAWAEVMLFPQRNKTHMDLARSFARAIEAAHGIKGAE